MKYIAILVSLFVAASALTSTSKIAKDADNFYVYHQTVKTYIDNQLQSETKNDIEILIRTGDEPLTIIGRLKNLNPIPENVTEDELHVLKDIESPFKLQLTSDGQPKILYGKEKEDRFSLKTKDSILSLLLQNITLIDEFLNTPETAIHNENCRTATHIEKNDKQIVYEIETKVLDCHNKTALEKVVSDDSKFKILYHLDKEDKKLVKANSVIDITYLTTVAARFETLQHLEYLKSDTKLETIDTSTCVEPHTPEEIDELWKSLPAQQDKAN